MKSVKHFFWLLISCALFSFFCNSVSAEIIFRDDFGSNNFSKVQNGASWGQRTAVTASNQSARFLFSGKSSGHAFSELRFDLGAAYREVWLQFRLFIPSNYKHRKFSNANNFKFLRIWPRNYRDREKVGFSNWQSRSGSSGSRLVADWAVNGQGLGPKGDRVDPFISEADRGKWMTVKIHVKAAASSSQHGTLRVWKNGNLVLNNNGTVNNYHSGEGHAYRYGYLLGWANAGFDKDTIIYIDDVIFATSEGDLGSDSDPNNPPQNDEAPDPPKNLRVVEK